MSKTSIKLIKTIIYIAIMASTLFTTYRVLEYKQAVDAGLAATVYNSLWKSLEVPLAMNVVIILLGIIGLVQLGYKADRINSEATHRIRMNDDIESCTDKLTGLWNRKFIETKLAKAIRRCDSTGYLYMCDMDNFKKINDTLGHSMGDEVLVGFAEVLKETLRPCDFACRFGGDEFILYVPRLRNNNEATAIYERIRHNLEVKFSGTPKSIVTLSCGATRVAGRHNVDELKKEADEALYFVKENGKNNFFVH